MFLWKCGLWYHLSSCLFALKELSLRHAPLSASTQYTSTADVTIAADIDSSGLGPAHCAASLIEDQMLEAEAQRVFHDWKWAFYGFPESMNKDRGGQCHVSCIWFYILELSGITSAFTHWPCTMNIHKAKNEHHKKYMKLFVVLTVGSDHFLGPIHVNAF